MEEFKNTRIHKDFVSLFNRKERITLLGENNLNLWILVLILFFTFVAIGFANGSLEYLARKMSDPYVNWVNVPLGQANSEKSSQIIENCNQDTIREKYDIISTAGYNVFWLDFVDYSDDSWVQTEMGRTIEFSDTLLSRVMAQSISGSGFKNENDLGLIVTQDMLDKYHYPANTKYIQHNYRYQNEAGDVRRSIPIPVLGVTASLPGNAEFISLPMLYYNRMHRSSGQKPFVVDGEGFLLLFVDGDYKKAEQISLKIDNYLSSHQVYGEFLPYNMIFTNLDFGDGHSIKVTFEPSPTNIGFIDAVYDSLVANNVIVENGEVIRLYDIQSRMKTNLSADHHGLAVNFRELGNIRAFASYMAAVNEVQIDIAQIEAKENYSFITRLTKIISLILIGFSILSICLFLSNLLKNHLEKIKMNIGTFKAFGLDSKTLHRIYMRVIFSVILGAMSLSIIASWLFGKVGGMRFLLKIFGSDNLESGESYFELFDQWTLLSIVLILLISFLVLSVTARKILRKSPGDLIYDR